MEDTEKIAVRDAGKIIPPDKGEGAMGTAEGIVMKDIGERIREKDRISRTDTDTDTYPLQREINGCRVVMHFLPRPSEGVMERMQSILSNAYEERVQNNLRELVSPKVS